MNHAASTSYHRSSHPTCRSEAHFAAENARPSLICIASANGSRFPRGNIRDAEAEHPQATRFQPLKQCDMDSSPASPRSSLPTLRRGLAGYSAQTVEGPLLSQNGAPTLDVRTSVAPHRVTQYNTHPIPGARNKIIRRRKYISRDLRSSPIGGIGSCFHSRR